MDIQTGDRVTAYFKQAYINHTSRIVNFPGTVLKVTAKRIKVQLDDGGKVYSVAHNMVSK